MRMMLRCENCRRPLGPVLEECPRREKGECVNHVEESRLFGGLVKRMRIHNPRTGQAYAQVRVFGVRVWSKRTAGVD